VACEGPWIHTLKLTTAIVVRFGPRDITRLCGSADGYLRELVAGAFPAAGGQIRAWIRIESRLDRCTRDLGHEGARRVERREIRCAAARRLAKLTVATRSVRGLSSTGGW
jgi:hypothetical protein